MALYLTNIAQMSAMRSFNNATASLNTTMRRLATGYRINSAKDDAAGLQISNRLTAQIDGYKQGSRNASDGQAVLNVAEGAIEEITTMLQRIRVLANQSATGTYTDSDRQSLNDEVEQLSLEINRIADKTTFGGAKILNGLKGVKEGNSLLNAEGKLSLQVGADAYDTIEVDLSAGMSLTQMTEALELNANGADVEDLYGLVTGEDGELGFDISTQEGAQKVLAVVDKFINYTSSRRGYMGAVSNRLDSVLRLNDTMRTNLADARARIRDTDYAEEASNLAQQMVQQQVALMVMQRAASQSSLILQLLQV